MTRPLRLEYPGALYHVTARGNRRDAIYADEHDRRAWLGVLRDTCARCNSVVHAYCQMSNHFHLLIETADANLSSAMRQLNGNYARSFNRRRATVGHLFQGRYKAILVQKESHLLELARYIVLNPVRAGLVAAPEQWDWSSYHWMVAKSPAPAWFDRHWLQSQFGAAPDTAAAAYRAFVLAGIGGESPFKAAKHALFLGDPSFVAMHRGTAPSASPEIAKIQRRQSVMTLSQFQAQFADRDEAMARAFWTTSFTMTQIGAHFGVSYKTVSRAVQRYEPLLRCEGHAAAGG